jgi:hypothetical protein
MSEPTVYILRERDYEYIVNRLYGDGQVMQAIERLQKLGRKEDASELMTLAQNYADQLREFRNRLSRNSPPRIAGE